MLLLNLLYYIIILVILLRFHIFFKSSLSYSKTRFLYDQIRIFFLLFYYSCCNIIVNDVVSTNWRSNQSLLINYFPINFRFKSRGNFFLTIHLIRVVWTRARKFIFILLFTSHLSWTKLSSISSLNLINQLILHCISWLVWPWTWYFCIWIYYWRTSTFLFYFWLLLSSCLLTKFKTYIVTTWTYSSMSSYSCWSFLKSFTLTKRSSSFSSFRSWHFRLFQISTRSRSSFLDILIITIIFLRSRIYMSWSRSTFFRKHSRISWILTLSFLLFNLFFSINNSTFSLIHSSHSLTSKIRRWFIIIQRTYITSLICTRSNSNIILLFYLLTFRLWPRRSSSFSSSNIRIILSRSNFISFLSFKIFNRRLIQF